MNDQWIKAKGTLVVDEKHNRIAISLGFDFINYYAWFLENSLKQRFGYPKYGAHISVYLGGIHNKINFQLAKKFNKEKIDFFYNPDFVISPKNFWLKVKCKRAEEIKRELGIKDSTGFLGLHLTIANKKDGIRKFQRGMITVEAKE